MYVSPGSRFEKSGAESENRYFHLVLLAASRKGYFNLVKLCSLGYTEGFYYRPRIDEELLAAHHEGLIALSACVAGEIPRLIRWGKKEEAEAKALYYRDLFGRDAEGNPNFFLEIQDHGIPAEVLKGKLSERQIYEAVIDISRKTGIPLAATNDVHYLNKEDAPVHDVLLCIGTGKHRSEERRKKYFGSEFYFKSYLEMASLFRDCPEALANTVKIAERCVTDIPRVKTKDLPDYLPVYDIPGGFTPSAALKDKIRSVFQMGEGSSEAAGPGREGGGGDAISSAAWLWQLTMEGLEKRYAAVTEEISARAEYELDVIIKMHFTGYFLIVADFINWAKNQGIWVGPGRGSGAGSIVAYALRITDLAPLKYGLFFERFLNPDRISMPDFDIDFCNERRDEVLRYVTEKYGRDQVAQIITFGTLGAKQVIKDVARTLEIPIPESEMITKLIPGDPKITLARAFKEEPKLGELERDPKYTEMFGLARKLEGLRRHASIHAAGVVIGKTALTDYVPLYREPESKGGGIATQYTMGFLEDCGLIKMDFLGLKTLDLLKHAEELVRRRGGDCADFSVEEVPEDDEKTFAMLAEEKNEGIFQFEKPWWKEILRKAKPASIGELTALNSLGRPGPMQFIPQFTESKWNPQYIKYPHPSLEGVLKETYGIIVYQEQVMQVARIVAGYTMGQADLLRRAMGKKKREIIDKEKAPFLAGALKQGYTEKEAGDIYELLVPFAGYGFNKSHAAAYSVLAYRTAYLKANYPAEFMAANLTNEIGSADKDKLSSYIEVTRKMEIPIDPPDINRSEKRFTVVEGRIVYGFLGIKGVGEGPADEIILRRRDGPFKGFMDFLDRVTLQTNQAREHIVSRKVIELLIKTGAFDRFGMNRPTLLVNMEAAIEYAQNKKDETKFGQVSLFEDTGEQVFPDFKFTGMPEMDRMEQLNLERELIGFYFSGHPLDEYRELWRQKVTVNLGDPDSIQNGEYILVGIVKTIKPYTDKSGRSMAFGTLEDYNGTVDIVFFNKLWEDAEAVIKPETRAALKGKIDQSRGKMSFRVTSVLDLKKLAKAATAASQGPGAAAEEAEGKTALGGEEPGKSRPGEKLHLVKPGLFREIHIRLRDRIIEQNLYPLRDFLIDNPGPSPVFIHIPPSGENGEETVIRTALQLSTAGDKKHLEALEQYPAVAEAWGA
jgi:DNA polymerase-3 subunit alpha